MAQYRQQNRPREFLPLCDVLFNIISLASYFCDVVFDLAMGYALAHHPSAPAALFPVSITLVVASLFISQVVSIRWYLWGARGKLTNRVTNTNCDLSHEKKTGSWTMGWVLLLHSTQAGVLWRYFKLFIPVDLTYVKHEVRELCVLRLIHAFCEAAPMLLLQLYLISIGFEKEIELNQGNGKVGTARDHDKLEKLTTVSAGLSLWSVCWAVASFSKGAARLRNLERLVLTWLGVLAQLFWRLGTVSARVGVLIAYASLYGGQWLLVVMALHWLSMLTWLMLTPDGLFNGGERLPLFRKTFLASLLAFVYVFVYLNLHETNHRQKMVIFYTVMFLENSLLIGVWAAGVNRTDVHFDHRPRPTIFIITLLALFFGGLCFMGLYYRFFHVRRLRYEAGGRMNGTNVVASLTNQDMSGTKHTSYIEDKKFNMRISIRRVKCSNGGIPGVFNCRFANPAVTNPNRKKKKPTTFVPPPSQHQPQNSPLVAIGESKQWVTGNESTRQLIPFWKRPLSNASINHYEDSPGERNEVDVGIGGSLTVNLIHEKLKEKKQQQLRELKAIQEEIKEGKLVPPPSASTSSFSSSPSVSNQKPPPNTKIHTSPSSPLSTSVPTLSTLNGLSSWPPVKMHCLLHPPPSSPYHPTFYASNHWKGTQKDRAETPEILLAPRCLSHHYTQWISTENSTHRSHNVQNGDDRSSKGEGEGNGEGSDMEGSQVSLPRSYTLPREFKYTNSNHAIKGRRGCSRILSSRFYLPSTNSSDGDVDSADNEEETDSEIQIRTKNDQNRIQKEHYNQFLCHNGYATNYSNSNLEISMIDRNSQFFFTNNMYCVPRINQLSRTKVKHETKL
ncbi:uncharacterized protein LOC117177628 isoform X2 [Belonocnema kinseyi]|uniref:uncharacterized protein LOC117177628 isoform X2 n=1 Tax=Belonocnema kinseyi TaxID=2817044 RepID=UPI00143E0082|nr:uncharacterized protein LOC117177628 isoform X2 [Belonocnema kinseyi]